MAEPHSTSTNGYSTSRQTDFDVKHSVPEPTSPSNFSLRSSTKSPFVKEYTYLQSDESQPDIQQQRRVDPREHGFSYMDSVERTGSPLRSPTYARSPTSPSSRPVTGLAFTYKPDSPATLKDSQHLQSRISPSAKKPLAAKGQEHMSASSRTSHYPVKSSPTMVTIDEKKSKSKSLRPSSSTTPDTLSGRMSRQSKDSKLDVSGSDSSISSGHSSSLDEYEKESYVDSIKTSQTQGYKSATYSSPSKKVPSSRQSAISPISGKTSSSSSVKSPPPPIKPKPTSLFEYQPQIKSAFQSHPASSYQDGYSAPKITHASRKRVVTNSDGSTVETEEVLEPSSMTSMATTTKSKPVVVGVVPSTQSSTTYSRPDSVFFAYNSSHFLLI